MTGGFQKSWLTKADGTEGEEGAEDKEAPEQGQGRGKDDKDGGAGGTKRKSKTSTGGAGKRARGNKGQQKAALPEVSRSVEVMIVRGEDAGTTRNKTFLDDLISIPADVVKILPSEKINLAVISKVYRLGLAFLWAQPGTVSLAQNKVDPKTKKDIAMAPKTYLVARKLLEKQIIHFHSESLQAVAEDSGNAKNGDAKIFLEPGSDFAAALDEEEFEENLDIASTTGERRVLKEFLREQTHGGDFVASLSTFVGTYCDYGDVPPAVSLPF